MITPFTHVLSACWRPTDLQGERCDRRSATMYRNNGALLTDVWASVNASDTIHSTCSSFFPPYRAPIKLLLIFQARGYGVNVQLPPQH